MVYKSPKALVVALFYDRFSESCEVSECLKPKRYTTPFKKNDKIALDFARSDKAKIVNNC